MLSFPATAALRAAYVATGYGVWLRGRTAVLRVGRAPPVLPWGVSRQAVFVSPGNPLGRRRARADNRRAQRRLRAMLAAAGLRAVPGEGRGDGGDWPPEPGVLVFGLRPPAAAALGRRLRQNAVVLLARRGAVRLLALR